MFIWDWEVARIGFVMIALGGILFIGVGGYAINRFNDAMYDNDVATAKKYEKIEMVAMCSGLVLWWFATIPMLVGCPPLGVAKALFWGYFILKALPQGFGG